MRKRLIFYIGIAVLMLISAFIWEYYCPIEISEYRSLSLLLQFLSIIILGSIVKSELEISGKERNFYSEVQESYNGVKKVIRSYKIPFKGTLKFEELTKFKNELDNLQLRFEQQRDFLVINTSIHANKKRYMIFAALVNIEGRIRTITKCIEKKANENQVSYKIDDFSNSELESFIYSKEDSFYDYFDEFQKYTYNYKSKKSKLRKAADGFIIKTSNRVDGPD